MCYAFQKNGVDTILAVPQEKNIRMEKLVNVIEQKLGKAPNFKIITYKKYTLAGRGAALGTYFGVKSILKKIDKIDVVFTRHIFINWLSVKLGFKVIFESHGNKLHASKILHKCYHETLIKTSKSDNQILFITISQALADFWIKQGAPASKIITLHDGFSEEYFSEIYTIEQSKIKLSFPLGEKNVAYVGSLYKDRGINDILKLAGKFEDVNFLVIGGPDDQKKYYESLSSKMNLKNVIFYGHINHSEVKKYLLAADVLLMLWSWSVPTIHICSPLKVFEYMAAERIILGQGFPTIKEVLTDSKNALLANPDSFEELAEKLKLALSMDYPNHLAKNARIDAINKYSWEKRTMVIKNQIINRR